jgi:CRISPR system Cascade subunit CasC
MTANNSRKSIELHIIHSFPAANINRDDTGNPKDCVFGGAHRLRVSSQCLKRAIRHHPVFQDTTQVENGMRTKRLALEWLKPALISAGVPNNNGEAEAVALEFARAYSSKKGKMDKSNPSLTSTLLYLSKDEIEWMTTKLTEDWSTVLAEAQIAQAKAKKDKKKPEEEPADDKKEESALAKDSKLRKLADDLAKATEHRQTSAPDIALFGRMLADRPETNVDAACQLAHALSTHAVKTETDFYTAVDDLKPEDTAGADMLGTIAFGSACYYRYARLDWNKLGENLGGNTELAEKTIKAFLLASEAANPSGMGNSHDNNTRPSFLLAVVRDDTKGAPWSLVNAFEEPVYSRDGYINESVKRMEDYWDGLTKFYGTDSVKAVAVAAHPGVKVNGALGAAKKASLNEWVDAVLQGLR